LILFFTLLGLITGYFILNQETDERKFELKIILEEHNYDAKQKLISINDSIKKIAVLERELQLISYLTLAEPKLPITKSIISIDRNITELQITSDDINALILEQTKNTNLYDKTITLYNNKVKEDFLNIDEQNKYILKKPPTYLSLPEDINGKKQVTIKIFFAQNYSEYIIENFTYIYLDNLIDLLSININNKMKNLIYNFEFDRNWLYDLLLFTLQNDEFYKNFFIQMFPKFNSKNSYLEEINKSGILNKNFDYFHESTNLKNTYSDKYSSRLILQDNNNIFLFAILGFVIGLIITFIKNSFPKKQI